MNIPFETGRLFIVSNRLPVVLEKSDEDTWGAIPGSGGLITALQPILKDKGGVWVGWPGTHDTDTTGIDNKLTEISQEIGYTLRSVPLNLQEVHDFYQGFSNEIIWPLFHDLQSHCNFDPKYWTTYVTVNQRYAEIIYNQCADEDFIWVHDYHLMHVAAQMRRFGAKGKIAFFLHIPFPSPDIFIKLPWRFNLLRSLLDYDLIGFQTMRDTRNFLSCVATLLPEVKILDTNNIATLQYGKRLIRVGGFPISIDNDSFITDAKSKAVSQHANDLRILLNQRQLILGIDRLDYTKGIPQRLEALRHALQLYPQLLENITLIQVVIPSRADIPEYADLKMRIERLVGEINGQFTRPGGWVPIHYIFRSLTRTELLAYYRAAEIALITPLKDGMNLVAKEYCACSIEEECVLILSEFAGAAAQLQHGALLVNPYDRDGVAAALVQAFSMPSQERRERMHLLRANIRHQDIFWWVDNFLKTAVQTDVSTLPAPVDYTPTDAIVDKLLA